MRVDQPIVDFGHIRNPSSLAALDTLNLYPLGIRHISLNGTCRSTSKMVLAVSGGSEAGHFKFADGGQMRLRLYDALLDGRAVDLALIRTVGDVPELIAPSVVVLPGNMFVPFSGGLAAEGTLLTLQVEVSPGIPMREFKTVDTKIISGDVSFRIGQY